MSGLVLVAQGLWVWTDGSCLVPTVAAPHSGFAGLQSPVLRPSLLPVPRAPTAAALSLSTVVPSPGRHVAGSTQCAAPSDGLPSLSRAHPRSPAAVRGRTAVSLWVTDAPLSGWTTAVPPVQTSRSLQVLTVTNEAAVAAPRRFCVDTFQFLWENNKERGRWVCSQPCRGVEPPASCHQQLQGHQEGGIWLLLTSDSEPALLERTRVSLPEEPLRAPGPGSVCIAASCRGRHVRVCPVCTRPRRHHVSCALSGGTAPTRVGVSLSQKR